MAVTGTIRVQGTLVGLRAGKADIDFAIDITSGIEFDYPFPLTETPAPFGLPANATLVLCEPPPGNTTAWQYSTDGVTFVNARAGIPLMLTSSGGGGTIYLKTQAGTISGFGLRAF